MLLGYSGSLGNTPTFLVKTLKLVLAPYWIFFLHCFIMIGMHWGQNKLICQNKTLVSIVLLFQCPGATQPKIRFFKDLINIWSVITKFCSSKSLIQTNITFKIWNVCMVKNIPLKMHYTGMVSFSKTPSNTVADLSEEN